MRYVKPRISDLSCLVSIAGLLAMLGCAPGPSERPEGEGEVGSAADAYGVPAAAERFEIKKEIVAEKLDTAVLPAMREHDVDMWITLDRENNYDPLHDEVGGGFPGVRAAYIFYDTGGETPEKIFIGSHQQAANSIIEQVFDEKTYYGYSEEGISPYLEETVQERDPDTIGVNTSWTLPSADGLTVSLQKLLKETIGPELAGRIESAELVVRDFRTHRTEKETELFTQLLEWTSRWEKSALAPENVTPGETTALDIAWWLRDQALELGMTGSGTVRVVREGELLPLHDPDIPLQPGDIISIDGGLDYLGFSTDIKRAAYILRPGETAPPESIQQAWQTAIDWSGRYAEAAVPGAVGHEIWSDLMDQARADGYNVATPDAGSTAAATTEPEVGVYGHSVGNVAHDIGTRIAQDIPFAYGDRVRFPLTEGEWHSVEFHVSTPIPEWDGTTWYARFEENARVGPDGIEWLIPYQDELLTIPAE